MDTALLEAEREIDIELEVTLLRESAATTEQEPTRWHAIVRLLPSVFLSTVALLLLGPIMPELKVEWFNNDYKRAQEVSGMASSAKFMLGCLVSPFLGQLSDKFGRRPLIRMSNVGFFLPVLTLYLTEGASPEAFFTVNVLCGALTSCQFFLFVAFIADCTNAHDRPRMFGYLGAISGVAFTLTPFVEHTLMNEWTNMSIFKLSMALIVVNAVWIELVLPESLRAVRDAAITPTTTTNNNNSTVPLSAHQRQLLFWLSVYVFTTHLVEAGLSEITMIYLSDVLHVGPDGMRHFTSGYLTLTGIGLLASQLVYIPLLSPKPAHTVDWMLAVACGANVLHDLVYATLSFNHNVNVAYANILITSFMFVGTPATNALISKHANSGQQGYMLGALDSVRSFVGAIGPVLFSFMYSYFGTAYDFPAAPHVVGAAVASLAFVLVCCGPLRRQATEVVEDNNTTDNNSNTTDANEETDTPS